MASFWNSNLGDNILTLLAMAQLKAFPATS